jgi:hypothetical protein
MAALVGAKEKLPIGDDRNRSFAGAKSDKSADDFVPSLPDINKNVSLKLGMRR